MPEAAATTRRFDEPDELRKFPLGRLELVQLGGMTIGRAAHRSVGLSRVHFLAWPTSNSTPCCCAITP